MKKKKNKVWTFIFSLIPGCAEMYWGLMKQGFSLLALFLGICFVSVITVIGPLMIFALLVWFYSFFHARNMAYMSQEELDHEEDRYLVRLTGIEWERIKGNKVVSWIFIIFGAWLLMDALWDFSGSIFPDRINWAVSRAIDMIPRFVIGCGVIWIGVTLIRGRKEKLEDAAGSAEKK